MAELSTFGSHMDEPGIYRIRVRGHLSPSWVGSLWENMSVTLYFSDLKAETVIIGEVIDQAQLLGIVNALYGKGYAVVGLEHVIAEDSQHE